MMLAKFRDRYPQGSLVSELVEIDRGIYIVRVSITVENINLATALAGASTVEAAEDAARERAIAALCIDSQNTMSNKTTARVSEVKSAPQTPTVQSNPTPSASPVRETPENIVNFSKSNPEVVTTDPVIPAPTIPTTVSKSSIPQISIEPEVKTPNHQSASNTANLFAGTSAPEEDPTELDFAPAVTIEPETVVAEPETAPLEMADFDFTQVKQKTDIEIERLGWTRDDGREFLQSRYGKRSRLHLKDEELLEFLHYLEKLPTPVN